VAHDENRFFGRPIVGGMGVGLAATVVHPIFAENMTHSPKSDSLQDPTLKDAKPPFNAQSQPWLGLASRIDPRPDHGETSYRGSGRLAGRKAFITGGDSGMGRAVAIAYGREGADVAINYLPAEEPDAREVIDLIRKEGRICVPIPGDLSRQRHARRKTRTGKEAEGRNCEHRARSASSSAA
jgi:short chain dehydrogenase